jgi:putative ABC transport system permease protein
MGNPQRMRRLLQRAPVLSFLPAAARIAWRDLAGARMRWSLAVAAAACGVAALGGVQGATAAFSSALARDLREAIAADVSVQTTEPPDAAQSAALDAIERRGCARTFVVETAASIASDRVPDPQLAMARVVDPGRYPFYGRVRLRPPQALAEALGPDTVAVSADVTDRLEAPVGSAIEVNGVRLRVTAIVESVPDQLSITPTPLPKLLLTHAAGERAGLLRPRTAYYHRTLFRLPPGVDAGSLRAPLERAFPGRKVLDSAHPDEQAVGVLLAAGRFLRAAGAIALLLGVLAVAAAMWAHLEQRLDAIAILRALGGGWRQALAIYGLQTAGLALAGGALGAAAGLALERTLVEAAPRLFGLHLEAPWRLGPALAAGAAGWLAGVLVPLPILLRVRRVRPYRILRRAMREDEAGSGGALAWLAPTLALAGLMGLATGSWRMALGGSAAAAGAGAALWGLARLTLAGLRRSGGLRLPVWLRQGVGNVLRPGNHGAATLATMAGALALLILTWLLQQAAVAALRDNIPAASANLFLLNVEAPMAGDFARFVAAQPEVEGSPTLAPFYSVRVLAVDGRPIDRVAAAEAAGLRRRWLAATFDRPPGVFETVEGGWWRGAGAPEVALPRAAAAALGARVGSRIRFEAGATTFEARVAVTGRIGPLDRFRCCFFFSPGSPRQEAAAWHGVVGVREERMAELRRRIYHAYPSITTVDAGESVRMLGDWLQRVLWMVRLAGLLAMASAAALMAASVAATRQWRVEEVGVLKALGARRGRLVGVYTAEFTVLGLAAGAIGWAVAGVAAAAVWRFGAEGATALPGLGTALAALAGSAATANLAGWLAVGRLLGLRPLAILRGE